MEPWTFEPARDIELSPVERARSLRRETGLISTIGHLGWQLSAKAFFKLYHRLSVETGGFIPQQPPFVMIANHASHLDASLLAAALPCGLCDRVFPVAAGDVFFSTPAMSLFAATLLNALPMWRKNCGAHALDELRKRLVEEPCGLILFPEGTRSRDGALGPFKAGLGMLTAGTTVPVIPCHLSGTFQAFPPAARLPRPWKIRLKIGRPLVFDSVPNVRDGWNQIANLTQEAVRQLGEASRG
ncbi:MAG: lysophospholipid acyltransferase family protein [Isosphaerales bacterium]